MGGGGFSASGVSPKGVKSKRRRRKKKKEERRAKVGYNNGQLRIANATSGGARKTPGPRFNSCLWVTLVSHVKLVPIVPINCHSFSFQTTNIITHCFQVFTDQYKPQSINFFNFLSTQSIHTSVINPPVHQILQKLNNFLQRPLDWRAHYFNTARQSPFSCPPEVSLTPLSALTYLSHEQCHCHAENRPSVTPSQVFVMLYVTNRDGRYRSKASQYELALSSVRMFLIPISGITQIKDYFTMSMRYIWSHTIKVFVNHILLHASINSRNFK